MSRPSLDKNNKPYKTTTNKKGRAISQGNARKHTTSSPVKDDYSIKAIDFDGTIAIQMEPYDPKKAGPPIPEAIKLVKQWFKEKQKVVIFTSRVNTLTHTNAQIIYARRLIQAWCRHHLGRSLPVTAIKHPMFEIWDNKAHRVETNTGRVLAGGYPKPTASQRMVIEGLTNALYDRIKGNDWQKP